MAAATLAEALAQFQAATPEIKRSKTVKVTTKTGGSYTFDYAPDDVIREAIQGLMGECGLACLHMLSSLDGKPSLRTVLVHTSGERIESEFPLPLNGHESAQEIGSMITYMKRYSLVSSLGLTTEDDDDGNIASGNTAKRKPAAAEGQRVASSTASEEELTAKILAAADKMGVKYATVETIAKVKAEKTPAQFAKWLSTTLEAAEKAVTQFELQAEVPA